MPCLQMFQKPMIKFGEVACIHCYMTFNVPGLDRDLEAPHLEITIFYHQFNFEHFFSWGWIII